MFVMFPKENLGQVLRLSARMTQRVTREVYLTSDFGTTVNDEHNRVIFNKVAHSVWEDLNLSVCCTMIRSRLTIMIAKSESLDDGLANRKVEWNKSSLVTFTNETYCVIIS
jgi:hypothetical protein